MWAPPTVISSNARTADCKPNHRPPATCGPGSAENTNTSAAHWLEPLARSAPSIELRPWRLPESDHPARGAFPRKIKRTGAPDGGFTLNTHPVPDRVFRHPHSNLASETETTPPRRQPLPRAPVNRRNHCNPPPRPRSPSPSWASSRTSWSRCSPSSRSWASRRRSGWASSPSSPSQSSSTSPSRSSSATPTSLRWSSTCSPSSGAPSSTALTRRASSRRCGPRCVVSRRRAPGCGAVDSVHVGSPQAVW